MHDEIFLASSGSEPSCHGCWQQGTVFDAFYDLAIQQPTVPESLKEHYRALGNTASACVGCRSCESRCPFEVTIAERMRKAAELFGC